MELWFQIAIFAIPKLHRQRQYKATGDRYFAPCMVVAAETPTRFLCRPRTPNQGRFFIPKLHRVMNSYQVSEQTAKIVDVVVMFEKSWNALNAVIEDTYNDETAWKETEGFVEPFKEIERRLGQILMESVVGTMQEVKNGWKVI